MEINSRDNKKFKLLRSLEKANKRRKENLFLIEGDVEIGLAEKAGIEIVEYFCSGAQAVDKEKKDKTTYLSAELFADVSYCERSAGVIALATRPESSLDAITLSERPLVLIIEKVEKPGNIGAMLRTADAVGADALILCEPSTDFYNPNVIRASRGAVFSMLTFAGSNEEVLAWLKANKIKSYAASLKESIDFRKPDYRKASAIVIGTEHDGLSDFWLENADHCIRIPMRGQADSLNASVSAAVILYEVERQRGA